MKTKAELKAALTSLQVNKPLRLHARQPQFITPTSVTESTPVAALTPAVLVTEVIDDTQASALTSVGPETQATLETPVPGPTMVTAATPVSGDTKVSGMTQVDVLTPVTPQTQGNEAGASHSASAQDSSVTLEAQTASKLHNGYTRLPNSYLMRMVAGEL